METLSTIKPKYYDTYQLKYLNYTYGDEDKDLVTLHLQSTTTGRTFVIKRTVNDTGRSYKKDYISKLVKYFIDVKRVDFTPNGFTKLSSKLTGKEVLLRMETSYKGVERKKLEAGLQRVMNELKKFPEPLELLPLSYRELRDELPTSNVEYTRLIRSKAYYENQLTRQFSTDREYRTFYKASKVSQYQNVDVQYYDLSLTKATTLLVSFQLRANDSMYCAVYDTSTGSTLATMNPREVVGFLMQNLDKLIITDYVASIQLQALLNGLDITYKTVSELRDKLEKLPNRRQLHIDTITNLLDTSAKPDFVERECHNVMRVSIKHDEALNCIQHLQNIKYLFDTRLKEHVASRHLAIITAKQRGIKSNLSLSELADALFYNGEINTYRFDMYELLHNDNLLVNAKVNNFLLEVADDEDELDEFAEFEEEEDTDIHTFTDLGINLTTGRSGYGGLRGYIPNYTNPQGTKIVHLDFSSFYPTILLDLNTGICNNVDLSFYRNFYDKKFSSQTSAMARTFYKQLINTAIGVLGSNKSKFQMRSRDTWKAIIKVGQLTMLNLLYNLEQQGAKILHVNTDGCFVEIPQDQTLEINNKYPLHIEEHSNIYINSLNDYMVGSKGNIICKGKYKHMECTFVTNLVIAKRLFNEDYTTVTCNLEDCYLYARTTQSRFVHLTDGFSNYEIDTRTIDYIEEYNTTHEDKFVTIDLNAYYNLADYHVYS